MLGFCPCFLLRPSFLFGSEAQVKILLGCALHGVVREVPITEERLVNRLVPVLKVTAQRTDFTRAVEYNPGGCNQVPYKHYTSLLCRRTVVVT